MWIDVDFKYGEPVIATIYAKDSSKFMKSEVKVKISTRPYYDVNSEYSCTEAKLDKWKEKTIDKISKAVLKSLPEELYGTININIKGLEQLDKQKES